MSNSEGEKPSKRNSPDLDRPNMSGVRMMLVERTGAASHLHRRKTTESPSVRSSSSSDRRIVLLGKTGVGKSATGNTILGEKCFKSKLSTISVTKESKSYHGRVGDSNVCVVDTPALYDTFADPVGTGRFTDQKMQIIDLIEMMFGEEVRKYAMVLFTRGDDLEGENIEELIKENERLYNLVQQCGGGYHVFNNKHKKNRQQVSELLQKIDSMVEKNGGTCFSNEMFEEAARFKQEEEERVRREKEERKQREKEQREKEIKYLKIEERIRQKMKKEMSERETRSDERKKEDPCPGNKKSASVSGGFFKKYSKYILLAGLLAVPGGAAIGAVAAVSVVGTAVSAAVGAGAGSAVGAGLHELKKKKDHELK